MAASNESQPSTAATEEPRPEPRTRRALIAYGTATLAVVAALGFALGLSEVVGRENVLLVFLAPVLISATRFGFLPAAWAALLSVAATAYYFSPPIFSLAVADAENVWALIVFIMVAAFVSYLADEVRVQVDYAKETAQITEQLYAFSQRLAGIGDFDELLLATAKQVSSMLQAEAVILIPSQSSGLTLRSSWPQALHLQQADLDEAVESLKADSSEADNVPHRKTTFLFVPLKTGNGLFGILGLRRKDHGTQLETGEQRLLAALANHTAVTLERASLAAQIEEARMIKETEGFRTSLLTSLTHDFKTPLASILGSISTLRHYGALYDDHTRDEMLRTAQDEAQRLDRFLGNLLAVTRLDTGNLRGNLEPTDLGDVVGAALKRCEKLAGSREIILQVDPSLPMVNVDFILLEQAVFNLMDNAIKYSPPGSQIDVSVFRDGAATCIAVEDQGPGIPQESLSKIFNRFYRAKAGDRHRAGIGLGLSVAKGFVEVMGGQLSAANRSPSGAVFTIRFGAPAAQS